MTDTAPPPPPAYPPPAYPQPSFGTAAYQPAGRTNGQAVGALVCGLIALFVPILFSIPALILGYSGRRAIARSYGAERGTGMATAGVVLGWLTLLLGAVIVIASLGSDDQQADDVEDVVAAVAPACRGEGTREADAYRGRGPFHAVIVGDRGRQIAWSQRDARWRAESVQDTELVACVAQQSNLIESCPYIGGPNIDRYEAVVQVRVVTARTGREVDAFELTDQPRQCQQTELVSTVRLDGTVSFRAVSERVGEIAARPA